MDLTKDLKIQLAIFFIEDVGFRILPFNQLFVFYNELTDRFIIRSCALAYKGSFIFPQTCAKTNEIYLGIL